MNSKFLKIRVAGMIAGGLLLASAESRAQMVAFDNMPGQRETFGFEFKDAAKDFAVQQTDVLCGKVRGANVLWPGETATFKFRVTNNTDTPITGPATIHVVGYGTQGQPGDIWAPKLFRVSREPDVTFTLDLKAKGFQDVSVTPKIPSRFGGYALVFDVPGHGQKIASKLIRTLAADPGRVQFPTYALDLPYPQPEEAMALLQRMGIKGFRCEFGYVPTSDQDHVKRTEGYKAYFQKIQDHELTAMLTVEGTLHDPWGVPFRLYLNEKNEGEFKYPGDAVWPPKYDPDFRKWTKEIAGKFGWPKGPVNAMELWNEPWEGISISGWGADLPRFREIYEQMALGIRDARAQDGTAVLSGGACSSTNTRDKLFSDGKDTFLPWLDFISIHYQPMASDPSLVPEWMQRKQEWGGPVKVWDTESWIANSEDRIGGVIASMRSLGQTRTAGIYQGNVYSVEDANIDGKKVYVAQAFSPGAALAATQKFIGQRPFNRVVFQNGLPWVYEFGGRPKSADDKVPGSPDDGTLVVVGDIGALYGRDRLLFRSVYGLKNRAEVDAAAQKLAATKPGTPEYETARAELYRASELRNASLTITASKELRVYDFYGNPVSVKGAKAAIPLNGSGYFLRTDGSPGSFAKLVAAVRAGQISGIEPVEIVAQDLTKPLAEKPVLRLRVTNVLNRPVRGVLRASLGSLELDKKEQIVELPANTTREFSFTVTGGTETADNVYALEATFEGVDGKVPHRESLRINSVSKRGIQVDGDLSDWKGVRPQTVSGGGLSPSLTQQAWLPFVNWQQGVESGLAGGYLAYDDQNFYFAAKIADSTPDEGMVRFETRDDDQYYYPAVAFDTAQKNKEMVWPEGTRRYSYRKNPDLPGGSGGHDNVQLAFNVIPADKKPLWAAAPGTQPKYQIYHDTDYEYALDPVAAQYGGGTEIWRLLVPGMPRKMFYPRQPKSPYDGPVKEGKLVIKRDGNTRIVECALPWTELPLVKQAVDAGKPVKFTFRVNDNQGNAYELANNRSVSKDNSFTFHDDWQTHWSNELEFGFER